ncbi:hypothetical protein JTE90_006048 [Oedothorax gibbosus]|uniref:Protein kinase domain-containing protein n=1 Tax=Oedothorax gibbosus TaxID=931172 RepID=A0AAV6V3M8_9ARAC|nr:hypothetical protein JTE90_006048 [Oedothorax gibbosus]
MERVRNFFRRINKFFRRRGSKKSKYEKENDNVLITNTESVKQRPNLAKELEIGQDYNYSAGDNKNIKVNQEETKISPEIIETLEFIIQQVESNISFQQEIPQQLEINLKDDQANENTTQIQEIVKLIEDIIQQVEHELDHPINKDQGSGIQGSTECVSNPKPPKSLEKATENLEPSNSLPPADPPRGLEEIKPSQTTATESRLEIIPSPIPKRTPKPWPEELEPLKDNYSYKGRLGKGGFGQVYKLRNKQTGEGVAAKVVPSNKVTVAETDVWPKLHHPTLLQFIEQHPFGKHHIFVSPRQKYRLIDVIYKAKFPKMKQYLLDALSGLEHLHRLGMCHLDVKPDNLLIGKHGAVWCDFGFVAESKGLTNASFLAPAAYRPPEASLSEGAEAKIPDGKAVDLWAFGVMLVELFTRFPLAHSKVKGNNWNKCFYPTLRKALSKKSFKKYFKKDFPLIDKNTCKALLDLIHAFLHKNPHNRMSAEEALKHPFFQDPVPKDFVKHEKDLSLWK